MTRFRSCRSLSIMGTGLAFWSCAAPTTSHSESTTQPARTKTSFDSAAIRTTLDPFINSFGSRWGKSWKLSGVVYAEAGERPFYERKLGFTNIETGVAPNLDTSFRIGSVTKQFTAAGIMALVEAGKIGLEETIVDVLPDYRGVNSQATIHQLLTHTAGIPSYTDVAELMDRRDLPHTPEQLVAAVDGLPATFPPGTAWAYSNTGYILLGMMIEARSATSYADFIQERLFDRAGLRRTVVGDAPGIDNRARGYVKNADQIEPASPLDLSVAWSAGGIRSTVTDLVRWDRALREGAVLSEASLRTLRTPSIHRSPYGPYACGWVVNRLHDRDVLAHGGGIDGFTTFFIRVPEDDLVIVAWLNTSVVAADSVANPVLTVAYGGPAPVRRETDPRTLDEHVTRFAPGHYRLGARSLSTALHMGLPATATAQIETMDVRVDAERNEVGVKPNGHKEFIVWRNRDGTYVNRWGSIRIEFVEARGLITGLVLEQGPLALAYVRADAFRNR